MIDLRSDTVTRPSRAMREVMAEAEVGDDVYGEDPTVNRLQDLMAEKLGKEDALLVSSGTQSNLLALLSHCQRGDEYIVGQAAHTYKYEGGGAAVLGSIQPQPLEMEENGTIDLEKVVAAIKPDDFHFAKTRLLCLENTFSGRVLPLAYLTAARSLTLARNLSLHLDGARIFNASVKQSIEARTIAEPFDSVSVCLSKGLGTPVGSILCGSREFIAKARRWRKMLGGGMRQAGILAAAGIYALENNIQRLAEDHHHAEHLASSLSGITEVKVLTGSGETNMVFIAMDKTRIGELASFLKERGILISARNPIRLVTHLDVSKSDIETVVHSIKDFFTR